MALLEVRSDISGSELTIEYKSYRGYASFQGSKKIVYNIYIYFSFIIYTYHKFKRELIHNSPKWWLDAHPTLRCHKMFLKNEVERETTFGFQFWVVHRPSLDTFAVSFRESMKTARLPSEIQNHPTPWFQENINTPTPRVPLRNTKKNEREVPDFRLLFGAKVLLIECFITCTDLQRMWIPFSTSTQSSLDKRTKKIKSTVVP